jgi:flagellar assembly protein FliH
MSSSTDTTPITPGLWVSEAEVTGTLETPELRGGTWTRLGDRAVLGDQITEKALTRLAQSTVEAARSQGYAVGWAQGRREAAAQAAAEAAEVADRHAEAEARREAEHAEALAVLAQAAADVSATVADLAAQLEEQALRLARELTTSLLGRELALATDPAADVVRRALAVLPDGGVPVTVRVHPEVRADAAAEALSARGVTVVADETLDRHDTVVETDTSYVDRGVSTALARVLEALS